MPHTREKHTTRSYRRLLLILLSAAVIVLILLLRPRHESEEAPAPEIVEDVLVHDGANEVWISPCAGVSVSSLKQEDFSNEDGIMCYQGHDYRVLRGIDVSEYQSDVDWQAVHDAGIDFVFVRCGWRSIAAGELNTDTEFAASVSGARKAGLEVGIYFYSQATTPEEAAEEAQYALELVRPYRISLPIVFDWERSGKENARTDAVETASVTDLAVAFCQTVQAAGYEAGIYFNRQLGYYGYDWSRLPDVMRWVADPGDCPDFYYEIDCWQYSFDGQINGIHIQTDLDLLFLPK